MIKRSASFLSLAICLCGWQFACVAQQVVEKPSVVKPSVAKDRASTKPPQIIKPAAAATATKKDQVERSAAIRTELLLPAGTKAWISVPDAKDFGKRFEATQFGELAANKSLKPFADSLRTQVKNWIDGQNVRLNLDMDQIDGVNSGEICFAGVLSGSDQHGIVFLMDVSKTRDKAVNLSKKISERLASRGAKQKEKEIRGVKYQHSVIENSKLFRTPRNNFKTIVDLKAPQAGSWMLVSNNEAVFRDVLRRLTNPDKIQPVETLSAQPGFKAVMNRSSLGDFSAQLRWFVDPFGYMALAQRIRDDEAASKVPRDNMAKKFASAGFNAFRGVGGRVALNTGQHEVLHRTFIYARRSNKPGTEKVFDLFDFSVNKKLEFTYPKWVPSNASTAVIGNWNTQRAFSAVGHFYDAQVKPGAWERTLRDLKQDPNLRFDLKGVVDQLGNRFVIAAATEKPITTTSERVVVGCLITGRADFVFENLSRANPDARVIKIGGIKAIEIDSTQLEEPEIGDLGDFDDLDLEDEDSEDDGGDEAEEEPRFELFEKRYIVTVENWLLVCNNKNYLRKLLSQRKSKLGAASDHQQVKAALAKLTDSDKVAWRHFGRLDLGLETNYEMVRRGEMATSQTMLARVINRMFANQAAEKARNEGKEVDNQAVREQELDGEKLPANYSQAIAPYLGPTGGVLETFDDGWRMTGVMLRKQPASVAGTANSDTKPALKKSLSTDVK